MAPRRNQQSVIDLKFESLHEKLDLIYEQTKKTNGRVTSLEEKQHKNDIINATHTLNCPQTKRLDKIEENLLEYNFLKKYPKAFYVGIAVMVFILIVQFFK